MFIGEEDCARDKRLPNDPYCHSHTRALSHALLSATTARLGEDFIVGQCPCDQFGATGLQEVWPQASFAHAPESLDALSRRGVCVFWIQGLRSDRGVGRRRWSSATALFSSSRRRWPTA